jgi:VIT1/CCC1 family predicted Fe2+/Mn2+ transporter
LLVAGVAGLVAGAMSMAAGEYVSVPQADGARDLARERKSLATTSTTSATSWRRSTSGGA